MHALFRTFFLVFGTAKNIEIGCN